MTSDQLKKIRLEKRLTISQMAESLCTPRGTYQKWERGERRIPGMITLAFRGVDTMKKNYKPTMHEVKEAAELTDQEFSEFCLDHPEGSIELAQERDRLLYCVPDHPLSKK